MRRNFTRLLETPTLFGGGNATVPKCAAVVLLPSHCSGDRCAGSSRPAPSFRRHTPAVERAISGIATPRTECCPCRSAPNHHTKPCHHSGQGPDGNVVADPCRELLAYI